MSDEFTFLIVTHSRTRNFQVGKTVKHIHRKGYVKKALGRSRVI